MDRHTIVLIILSLALASCGGSVQNSTNQEQSNNGLDCTVYVAGTNDRDDFLCAHNQVRETATPTPTPTLEPLTWNDNLASVAQAWADNCSFEHNPDRSTQYNGLSGDATFVGENLYASTSSSADVYDAVTAWEAESANYDYNTNSCAPGEICGHYTQLVWRDTLQLGCGIAICPLLSNTSFTNATLIVCNYEPAGNFINQLPY